MLQCGATQTYTPTRTTQQHDTARHDTPLHSIKRHSAAPTRRGQTPRPKEPPRRLGPSYAWLTHNVLVRVSTAAPPGTRIELGSAAAGSAPPLATQVLLGSATPAQSADREGGLPNDQAESPLPCRTQQCGLPFHGCSK